MRSPSAGAGSVKVRSRVRSRRTGRSRTAASRRRCRCVSRLAHVAEENAEAVLGRFGLSEVEFLLLAAIRTAPEQHPSPRDLLDSLMVTSSGLTNRIDRLEAAGLVERTAHAADRRGVRIELTDYVFGYAEAALFVLLGGVALLLLIACANVTGLLIVRSQSRRRDVAVQCALGIGWGRLFRAHLLETPLVSGAAAAGGIALASAALPVLVALGPVDMPRLEQATVHGTSIRLGVALALVLGIAMAALAYPRPGRLSVAGWLRAGVRGATTGRAGTGARHHCALFTGSGGIQIDWPETRNGLPWPGVLALGRDVCVPDGCTTGK